MKRVLSWRAIPAIFLTVGLVIAAVLALALPSGDDTASAALVDPTPVDDNPTCISLGYDVGFKPTNGVPDAGTYTIPGTTETITISYATDSLGTLVSFTSTLPLDAVIVKGGPNANVYEYDPEVLTDSGLHPQINPQNDKYYGLSHLEFCYDFELNVSKTATTTFTRTWEWDITKSVTPETWDLFDGDSGTSDYTVEVTKTGYTDSDWAVSGTITIKNPSTTAASISGVSDVITGGINATVNCGVSFPYSLAAGGTLACSYSASLPDGTNRTNTATVTTTGTVGGGSGTAAVTFGDPTTVVNGTVTVTDTFDGTESTLGTASDDKTFNYSHTFTCAADEGSSDEGTHNNTAEITETGDTASESVDVNCYDLDVTKTADTELTRTYEWTIDKSVSPEEWDLFNGESGTSKYTVTVTKTGSTDSDWAVSGDIVITNNNPSRDATLTGVTDLISPDIAGDVVCPSLTVPAGGALTCTYSADLPDGTTRTNTATATQQNYAYDSAGVGTPDGTTNYSGDASVDFTNATVTPVNATINVTDTLQGSLGSFSDTGSTSYTRTFTCNADEGTTDNTATIVETNQSDSASVEVDCHDIAVTKTANPALTRTWNWTIEKTVTPDTWDLFTGDSGTSEYTVKVDKTGSTDTGETVSGTVTITNPAPIAATINSLSDILPGVSDGTVNLNCGAVSFPYTLAANSSLECTYTEATDGSSGTNTATAVLQLHNYDENGNSSDAGTRDVSGTADFDFADATVSEVNPSINVTDTNGMSWGPVSDDATWNYSRTFTCDGDEGTHDNTATITETGQSDSASVEVNCYALGVTKDATTSFTRTWSWTIDKSADQTALILADGQTFQDVNYTVKVDATSADSGHAVSGAITVTNTAPIDAVINNVTDILPGASNMTVNCGVTFPYTLAADDTLNCTYSADLPGASSQLNTATATLQNYDYDKTGAGTPSGTTNFSGTANVTFSTTPTNEVDECIDVTDDKVNLDPAAVLGTVCAGDAPKTFTYTLSFGHNAEADVVVPQCETTDQTNTAEFITNDTESTGSDTWTVNVTGACPQTGGCTLTPGYWKTHNESFWGGAPVDDTWVSLLGAQAEGTTFYLSNQSYFDVMWTAPKGNAYYILARAYIASILNVENGASTTPAVDTAIAQAETLFQTYTPAQIAALKGKAGNELRSQFISLAGTLDAYNNGNIGPGHCSEDNTSDQS